MNHETFLQRAIDLAVESVKSGTGGPFGAVIVKDGQIIAEGKNNVTTSNDPTAHAEVTAIRLACEALGDYQLNDCILYTSCEPCPMCLGAIYWARPKEVYFAAQHSDAASAGFDDSFI
ncbi:nucleoside deaminase, partial [Bacillus paralicheniformis]